MKTVTSPDDTSTKESRGSRVPSVEKAVKILNLLAGSSTPMSLAGISSTLGFAKSTTFVLCASLVGTHMMLRRSDGRYELGPHVVRLSRAYLSQTDVPVAFACACADEEILPMETIVMSVLDGTDVVYLAQRRGERPLGVAYEVGLRLPAHCSASGKSLLARYPDEIVRALYGTNQHLDPLTEFSITSLDELVEHLNEVRDRGYAVDNQETAVGMICIGAAVSDAGSQPVAAVAASLVGAQIADDAVFDSTVSEVRRLVGAMSRILGHSQA